MSKKLPNFIVTHKINGKIVTPEEVIRHLAERKDKQKAV
jgi:hypothetical protein